MGFVAILGVLIGSVMGLTGAGGGILAVPVLVAGMHWTMQQAAPVALIAVSVGAAVGAIDGFRHGLVRYKAAMLMAICGIPVTSLGLYLASILPQFTLMVMFAALMMLVSWRMFRQSKQAGEVNLDDPLRLAHIHADTGKFIWNLPTAAVLGGIGALTGLMTGMLGVGGGFLIVPLMRRFTHLAMPGIVATSLFLITLVGSGGVINAVHRGAVMPMPETLLFVGVMTLGMLIGRRVSRLLQPAMVQRSFSLLLAAVSCFLVAKAIWLH